MKYYSAIKKSQGLMHVKHDEPHPMLNENVIHKRSRVI